MWKRSASQCRNFNSYPAACPTLALGPICSGSLLSFPSEIELPKVKSIPTIVNQRVVRPMSTFWLIAWSLTLAVGWLLPNHYPPWSTFHSDAWVATAFMLASAAVLLRSPAQTGWTGLVLGAAFLTVIPALQFAAGLVGSAGSAWVSTAYLLGFLLALLTGASWESAWPAQPADGLLLAIGIAAVMSVGLQLHQWLGLGRLDIWSMGDGFGRPFANFGQPNQLGTFLLWALLATLWGLIRRHIGGRVAFGLALYLLIGLALTASRTSWIGVALLVLAAWWWRAVWPSPRVPAAITCLALIFVLLVLSISWASRVLVDGVSFDAGGIDRLMGESRPAIWALFVDGVLTQPWFGYGWNQVALAHMMVAQDHPPLSAFFSHSHNLFLDLVLWGGIPLGISVAAVLVWWLFRCVRAVRSAEQAVMVLFLLVVANHAMLELPLHHAYFLLPVGLMMGALETSFAIRPIVRGYRWVMAMMWMLAAALLSLIVRDYMLVESSYKTLRFEWANIKTEPAKTPEVILLTQWRDFFQMIRLEPSRGMTEAELIWMRNVAGLYPSAGFSQKLAAALALNQRPVEAALSLQRLCRLVPERQCLAVKLAWENHAKDEPLIAKVPWPK